MHLLVAFLVAAAFFVAGVTDFLSAAVDGRIALSLRGRDRAAVVSNSLPRLFVIVSGTEARVVAIVDFVFAIAPLFWGGMTAIPVARQRSLGKLSAMRGGCDGEEAETATETEGVMGKWDGKREAPVASTSGINQFALLLTYAYSVAFN